MTKYKVKTRLVFEGQFEIDADSAYEAQDIVKRDCGLVLGGCIQTTRDEEVFDREFPCHCDKEIVLVTRLPDEEEERDDE